MNKNLTYYMQNYTYVILIVLLFSGCRGKEGIEGKKSLIDLVSEAPGVNCSTGGYKILTGIDLNGNNILDATEVQSTKYLCNGIKGNNSLAALIQEPAGINCVNGGYILRTGIDSNNNNILDPSEVQNSQYVCNGVPGNNSLVALVKELAGTNCLNGGYKVNSGVDLNKNGNLEPSEVQSTTYICNGNNGFNSLISVKAELSGTNCTYGGYSFSTGTDINKNGVLESNEISGTAYVCNNSSVNEVRIPLDYSANTINTTPVSGLALANFNKANYVGMDSIVVAARLYSGSVTNNSIFDLINLTDNVVLQNSLLMSNKPFEQSSVLVSRNLYNELPDKSINIGVRLRSQIQGSFSGVYGTSYLILYQKK